MCERCDVSGGVCPAEAAEHWEAWGLWLHKLNSTLTSKEVPWGELHRSLHTAVWLPRLSGASFPAHSSPRDRREQPPARSGHLHGAGVRKLYFRQAGGLNLARRKGPWGRVVNDSEAPGLWGLDGKGLSGMGCQVGMYQKREKEESRTLLLKPGRPSGKKMPPAPTCWVLIPLPRLEPLPGSGPEASPPGRQSGRRIPQTCPSAPLRDPESDRLRETPATARCAGLRRVRWRWRPGRWRRKAWFLFLRSRETRHRIPLWASSLPGTEDPGRGRKVSGSVTFSAGCRLPPIPLPPSGNDGNTAPGPARCRPAQGPPGPRIRSRGFAAETREQRSSHGSRDPARPAARR